MQHPANVRVRGIYTTALTALLLEQGFTIVDASPAIQQRFGLPLREALEDVSICDRQNRQGVMIEGEPAHVTAVVEGLQRALPQALVFPQPQDAQLPQENGTLMTWLAAALHEVPQELGDFGVLVHGGWSKRQALLYNLASALTFLLGSLIAYTVSFEFSLAFLVPFAAGNFIYIGASDLVPEINKSHASRLAAMHFACFVLGLALLFALHGFSH